MALYRKLNQGASLKIPHSTGKYIYESPDENGLYDIPEGDATTDEMVGKFVEAGVLERADGTPPKPPKPPKPAKTDEPKKAAGRKPKGTLAAKLEKAQKASKPVKAEDGRNPPQP